MSTNAELSDRNIVIVEQFLHAMETQNMELAYSLLSDDVVYQNVPLPADRGKAAVIRTLKRFARFVDSFEVKMINIAARDGVVLTERIDILSGPYVYLNIWVCGTFEVEDGKIRLWRDYFDLASSTAKLFTGRLGRLLSGK